VYQAVSITPFEENVFTITTGQGPRRSNFRGRGESEVAMKKLGVGVFLALAFLFAQTASAEPCGRCQAYYPCDWSCEHCVRGIEGPGYWIEDGYCWGEVVYGTCGDIGQCGANPCTSTWPPNAPAGDDKSVTPEQGAQSLLFLMPIAPPIP
jgi:hypothetical protein